MLWFGWGISSYKRRFVCVYMCERVKEKKEEVEEEVNEEEEEEEESGSMLLRLARMKRGREGVREGSLKIAWVLPKLENIMIEWA